MHDFPPVADAYLPGAAERPDTRAPARFLGWLLRAQWDVFAAMVALTVLWQLPGVRETRTYAVMEEVKNTTQIPL